MLLIFISNSNSPLDKMLHRLIFKIEASKSLTCSAFTSSAWMVHFILYVGTDVLTSGKDYLNRPHLSAGFTERGEIKESDSDRSPRTVWSVKCVNVPAWLIYFSFLSILSPETILSRNVAIWCYLKDTYLGPLDTPDPDWTLTRNKKR